MATIYSHKDNNIRNTWVLMLTFFIVVIAFGFVISAYFGNPSLLYIAVFISILMNVGSYWFSDKVVIKMTGAKLVERTHYPDLWNSLENLSITAGLPMPKLYIVEDNAPNAFATGRNPEHAAVAVTTGLLKILNKTELEGVLAHELSHIGNRDMLIATVVVVLVGFVAILSDIFLRSAYFGGNNKEGNKLQVVALIAGIVLAIFAPLIARLIHFAISRKREFLADASGVLLTRYPEGLATALQKISAYVGPMQRPSHATAHLFISDPFDTEDKKGFFAFIDKAFSTHPPVKERVSALLGNKQ
ncbi:MAG: M48 family metallopeptidase [Patescibacteria group bacterium]